MEGHQRNLDLYDRFNARVLGVSRDDVTTLKYRAKSLDLTFPLLSNITAFLGAYFDIQPEGQPIFERRTEAFGSSAKLEEREREFFKRFLFNAILQFQVLEKRKTQVLGGEGLEVVTEGKDLVKGEKVRAKVVFGKRGERIVGFYITQWRPINGTYELSAFEIFDKFVKSFKFLKKSFYETL
jgi:peroxiredoxin